MKEKLLQWLDRALMLDLFLVLASFFWLAIALVGRWADVPLGLDLWYDLWEPVFTPALGILMLGAIANGIVRQISKRFGAKSQ